MRIQEVLPEVPIQVSPVEAQHQGQLLVHQEVVHQEVVHQETARLEVLHQPQMER